MNISEAINAAADHIERFPKSYDFSQGQVVPKTMRGDRDHGDGGFVACMLARVGEFAGAQEGTDHATIASRLLGMNPDTFYNSVAAAMPAHVRNDGAYHHAKNAPYIARGMRAVAKQYEGIPDEVRQIFRPIQIPSFAPTMTPLTPNYRVYDIATDTMRRVAAQPNFARADSEVYFA